MPFVTSIMSIASLLQMASGVRWDETYPNPRADRRRMLDVQISQRPGAILELMSRLPRAASPGSVWNYSTGETHVAGALVQAAVGRPLAVAGGSPNETAYQATGIFGQHIYMNPKERVVIVVWSALPKATATASPPTAQPLLLVNLSSASCVLNRITSLCFATPTVNPTEADDTL